MKVRINALQMNFSDEGKPEGTPLLFIHGFPFSSAMWQQQVEHFSKTCRVITYDIRGHGASEIGDAQFSIEYFVDDILALLQFLNIPRAVIIGLSMGGYIALRMYERHPEKFLALVLCDTKSEADTNEGKIRRAQQAPQVKAEGAEVFARAFAHAVFFEKSFQTNPDAVAFIKKIIAATSPLAIAGTLLALAARTDSTPMLETISVPALVLVGEKDTVTPVAHSQILAQKIPTASLNIITDAGHLSNLENNVEFNTALEQFLHTNFLNQ